MGRFSEPPSYDLAKATADAKAYLHSGPKRTRTFVPDSDGVAPPPDVRYEASGAGDQPSSSDELATPELFGTVSDAAFPDIGTEASGYPGELLWFYKDIVGKEHGPFPESCMRRWWRDGEWETNAQTGPELLV